MPNSRLITAALAAVGALAAVTGVATAAPVPTDPPSLVQLCAATGVEEIDQLLDDVARSQLVGELSPLLTLLVPETESVELDASVQLEDVRDRLNCAPVDEVEEPTTDPTPTPTPAPDDDTPAEDDDGGQDDDEDLLDGLPDRAPRPTVVDADLTVTG